MKRTTKILAAACAALALTASFAFAADATDAKAVPASWQCPGLQSGQAMGPGMMNGAAMSRMMGGQMMGGLMMNRQGRMSTQAMRDAMQNARPADGAASQTL